MKHRIKTKKPLQKNCFWYQVLTPVFTPETTPKVERNKIKKEQSSNNYPNFLKINKFKAIENTR